MLEDNVEAVMSLFEAVDVTTAKVIAQAIVTLFVQNGNVFALLKGVVHREIINTRILPPFSPPLPFVRHHHQNRSSLTITATPSQLQQPPNIK